ncbi:MAG TPA: ATP-grasp domain-containing protein [Nitrospirota bacterium]|nr:ATP-grasp domain-containing protein [Nitrospirota bacterium]
MNFRIGELTFLEQLAQRYKLPVPEFLSEPVSQSKLKEKLEQWGAGIVKPDVLIGKRGKAGAVRKVDKELDALRALREVAATEVNGLQPRTTYIVQYVPADLEVFSSISYNSHTLSPAFTVSLKGGMDVETIADQDKVTVPLNVFQGLDAYQASEALSTLGLSGKLNSRLSMVFVNLWDMFISTGMLSCEVNPWRVTNDGQIFACDFKATFDENNFKAKDVGLQWPEYPTVETEFESEMKAWAASSHQGQAHVSSLGGKKILPMLFGGGASTIIIETLTQLGGDPIFLSDFGGNPPYDRMKKTASICFKHHLHACDLLLLLGGKANNTLIDVTFSAIADALLECVDAKGPVNIPVIVGRGGAHLIQGFEVLKKALDNLQLPYVIFGPDTPITLVAEYAANIVRHSGRQMQGGRI